MSATRTEIWFGIYMAGVAIISGLIAHNQPQLKSLLVPPFSWPLFAALLFDLATLSPIRQEKIEPMRHGVRVAGVVAAAALVMLMSSTTV
jgi:hypothetical protein